MTVPRKIGGTKDRGDAVEVRLEHSVSYRGGLAPQQILSNAGPVQRVGTVMPSPRTGYFRSPSLE